MKDHALLAEVHASLGGSLVRAVLKGDDVLAGSQGLLREVARVSFGLSRPHPLTGVAGVRLHLKQSPTATHVFSEKGSDETCGGECWEEEKE